MKSTTTPKLLSLVFLIDSQQNRVLLGLKKRGFGKGRWNGFGGKLENDETMPQCAARELAEECGLTVSTQALRLRASLAFDMLSDGMVDSVTGTVSSALRVSVFSAELADVVGGELTASDEMEPRWWPVDEVPLGAMWPDDAYWLPQLLGGANLVARFTLGDKDTILEREVRLLDDGVAVVDAEAAWM